MGPVPEAVRKELGDRVEGDEWVESVEVAAVAEVGIAAPSPVSECEGVDDLDGRVVEGVEGGGALEARRAPREYLVAALAPAAVVARGQASWQAASMVSGWISQSWRASP